MTRTVTRSAITQAMQLALWKRWGWCVCEVCRYMVLVDEFHWDHHLALVDGGKHEIENLRPICKPCHKIKSAHEHKENARAKRRARKHSQPTPPGSIKSRSFDTTRTRKMNGRVVPRAD